MRYGWGYHSSNAIESAAHMGEFRYNDVPRNRDTVFSVKSWVGVCQQLHNRSPT